MEDDAGARSHRPHRADAAVIVICLGVHALLMRCGLGVLFDPLQATDRLVPRLRR